MIAKHVPMKSVGKSDFAALASYLTDEQRKQERIGIVNCTNCQADTFKAVVAEVIATQCQNQRAESDKTYHLIVSFRAGEQPSAETLKAIESRICEGLGFAEHQRISAVHHDTDNLHVHIAINKIHPTRHTIHEPFYPHKTLAQLCEKLEGEYGLEVDNHQANKRGAESCAQDMERHSGVESLLGWIKRECIAEIQAAKSWDELHQVMRSNGLELRERANGLVIVSDDGTAVKASSIARELSKAKLEERFGAFQPSPEARAAGAQKPKKSYDKKPVRSRVNTVELYAKYRAEQQAVAASRTDQWAKALDRKNRLIEAAKRAGGLKRATIKLAGDGALVKKLAYAATAAAVKAEIERINADYRKDRQAIDAACKRRAWADWLRAKAIEGDTEALGALRARQGAQGLKGDVLTGQKRQEVPQAATQDGITKQGTVIHRAGTTAIRDDGDRLSVSRGATNPGLVAALEMARQRYGDHLTVNGSAAFKEQIARAAAAAALPVTFADPVIEQRRQELLKPRIKETANVHNTGTTGAVRGRPHSERDAGARYTAARVDGRRPAGAAHVGTDRSRPVSAVRHAGKPNVGRVGRSPPPQSQNRLRRLSELGVVRIAGRSEVLLPRDVPRHVEQQGAQPDHGVRRDLHRAGGGLEARPLSAATPADKYIAEREAKRLQGFAIAKHSRFTESAGPLAFAGARQVEGQSLALVKRGDEIMVLPVDEPTAQRMKRIAIGAAITVTAQGSIKTKGRSR